MEFSPAASSSPPRLWDIFCQVVDNHGDLGVCWRLTAELAARGERVRLWCDDASALAWMAPQAAATPGVELHDWREQAPANGAVGDVVIEAFGCDIPAPFLAAMARAHAASKPLVWINLEYLSAEDYVERCHRLPSPIMSGPARGLIRWFFYPGFTERTGGLLREQNLPSRQALFDRPAWRRSHGLADDDLAISLFCYEPAPLANWLDQLRQLPHARLLVAPGRPERAMRQALAQTLHGNTLYAPWNGQALPHVSQVRFDERLWACDLNMVRGEDSLVRALWAGQPLVWHIYPQHDDAHHAKLQAFLDWLDAPASLVRFHRLWNGVEQGAALPLLNEQTLADWRACILAARQNLLQRKDLVSQLLGFVQEKS